ncbi:MAG: MFS transporter [Pseudomonadota bacterium]|nr:MFS transporter [Pseudomonadota bacterium]
MTASSSAAFRFVLMIGIVSLFADFVYEGSRSITGPYLAQLGASGTIVGVVTGLGELLGYGLRLVSGRLAERTGKFWPITILGYAIQMASVPLLALAGSWQVAALLIVAERIGKATRNPPRNVMLSHAGNVIGQGWVFGLHEALDQAGAMIGPLSVAAVLAHQGDYKTAFVLLLIPALMTLALVGVARWIYPRPGSLEAHHPDLHTVSLPRAFWIYLAGAALVAAGFPDFSLMSFHFERTGAVPPTWIPIFYAIAMGTSGLGSLVFGALFDRKGIAILIPLTLVTAVFVPLAFLGGFAAALIGSALWGMGMGVHESIIPAAVAGMVPLERRASAYGLFTAAYGISWFLGSAVIGMLYDISLPGLIGFSIAAGLAAIPFFILLRRQRA